MILKSNVKELASYISKIYTEKDDFIRTSKYPFPLREQAKEITKSNGMKWWVYEVHQVLVGAWTRTLVKLASYLKVRMNWFIF